MILVFFFSLLLCNFSIYSLENWPAHNRATAALNKLPQYNENPHFTFNFSEKNVLKENKYVSTLNISEKINPSSSFEISLPSSVPTEEMQILGPIKNNENEDIWTFIRDRINAPLPLCVYFKLYNKDQPCYPFENKPKWEKTLLLAANPTKAEIATYDLNTQSIEIFNFESNNHNKDTVKFNLLYSHQIKSNISYISATFRNDGYLTYEVRWNQEKEIPVYTYVQTLQDHRRTVNQTDKVSHYNKRTFAHSKISTLNYNQQKDNSAENVIVEENYDQEIEKDPTRCIDLPYGLIFDPTDNTINQILIPPDNQPAYCQEVNSKDSKDINKIIAHYYGPRNLSIYIPKIYPPKPVKKSWGYYFLVPGFLLLLGSLIYKYELLSLCAINNKS